MRALVLAGLFLVAAAAAVILFSTFPLSSPTADTVSAGLPTHTPSPAVPKPTPEPHTWIDGLETSKHGVATLISCLDLNGDGEIDDSDSSAFDGLAIPLVADKACIDPAQHRDFYVGDPSDAAGYSCDAKKPPLLIVAIGSAGTDLYDLTMGESLGVLHMVNLLQQKTTEQGIATTPILAGSAIAAADEPQTRMEEWLTHDIEQRLDAMPCLRAVMIGHSHGGVTVTSVAAALDAAYADRVFGVLIDRTIALYDRPATEMPTSIPLLNFYQLNEGWHGVPLNLPNVTDIDESTERAPVAPSDGGGGLAIVSHKTLDDATPVQQRVVDGVMAWLAGAPAAATPTPAD
jgi:pimeloyl-ACP methyl ester carboxylesterase